MQHINLASSFWQPETTPGAGLYPIFPFIPV